MPRTSTPNGKRSAVNPAALTVASGALQEDIRMGLLVPIPDLLRDLGCDPASVLAAAGFDGALFGQPDARVPYSEAAAMFAACAEASGVAHFGLLLGIRFQLPMLGPLVPLMRNCDTVGAALRQLVRHLHVHDRGAAAYLARRGRDEVALGYTVYAAKVDGLHHIYDLANASICNILRDLCGAQWLPDRVSFAHLEPALLDPYHQVFQAPLHFDAPYSEVVFDRRWLEQPIAGADPLRRLLEERVALHAETKRDSHFVERVRRAIYELLMGGEVSTRLICMRLGVHERVLRRHLHAESVTVKQLTGQARHQIACQLLCNTQLSLAEVAAALAYSDPTAFSRAFRNHCGQPPEQWRRQARGRRTKTPTTSAARTPADRIPDSGPSRRGTAGRTPVS